MTHSVSSNLPYRVYVDGIFDIPHDGHLAMMVKAVNKAAETHSNVELIVGVCDEGVKEYKRAPIMSAAERAASLRGLIGNLFAVVVLEKDVPIKINTSFIKQHQINMVVRGDDFSPEKIREYYADAIEAAEFVTVPYTKGVSTSEIITNAKTKGSLGIQSAKHLTVSENELVRRIQALSWSTLCIKQPSPSLSFSDRIAQLDIRVLRENYWFAQKLRATGEGALLASFYSLRSAIVHTVALTVDLVKGVFISIKNRHNDIGNPQLIFSRMTEIIRDIAGAIFSTPLALWKPLKAADLFHVKNDDYMVKVLSPEEAADLYAITYLVTTFLEENGIQYRMSSGTFLGALRHKGIIPWDDDVDLLLEPDADEKLKRLIESGAFKDETGLMIKWHPLTGGWQIYFEDGKPMPSILQGTLCPFVDLFSTKRTANGRIEYASNIMHALSPNEYYTEEEWLAAKAHSFGPINVTGPDETANYFNRSFGPYGMDLAFQTIHHVDFRFKNWPQRVLVRSDRSMEYDHERFKKRISKSPIEDSLESR